MQFYVLVYELKHHYFWYCPLSGLELIHTVFQELPHITLLPYALPQQTLYSDTSANEDNSFQSHIRQPKRVHFSSWNGPTVHVCCFMLARASTKTFISRIHIHQPSPKNSEKNLRYPKNSLAGSLVSRGITVYKSFISES